MADVFDVTRIDPLPGRSPRDGVDPLRRPADQQRQKKRQHPHRQAHGQEDEEDKQVGTRLDVRA